MTEPVASVVLIQDEVSATHSDRNSAQFDEYRRTGSLETRNRIIEGNLGLVSKIARKYVGTGLDFNDLRQEGVKGLIRAVELFDPGQEVQFSSYACRWIASFIENEVSRNSTSVKVPERTRKLVNKLKNRERQLISEGLSDSDIPKAIAQETGMDVDKVKNLMAIRNYDVQLDAPTYRDETGASMKDQVVDERNFEDQVILDDQMAKLKGLVAQLPEQRRMAIEYYHGFSGEKCENFGDVAKLMGVSRQRVNVIYHDGIAQIRSMLS